MVNFNLAGAINSPYSPASLYFENPEVNFLEASKTVKQLTICNSDRWLLRIIRAIFWQTDSDNEKYAKKNQAASKCCDGLYGTQLHSNINIIILLSPEGPT